METVRKRRKSRKSHAAVAAYTKPMEIGNQVKRPSGSKNQSTTASAMRTIECTAKTHVSKNQPTAGQCDAKPITSAGKITLASGDSSVR